MELQGRVTQLLPLQTGTSQRTGSNWQRQDFLFEYFENPGDIYSRRVLLSVMNERIAEYHLQPDDEIKVRIGLGCRERDGRYYNEIYTGQISIVRRANGEAESKPTNGVFDDREMPFFP